MAPEAGLLTRMTRLLVEMRVEQSALDRLSGELAAMVSGWADDGPAQRPELTVAAVDVHGYYTALEALLERVAKLLDREVPSGASWHADLVSQMTLQVPGQRPALVPTDVVADLAELRRFRHFFRSAYVLDLDPARVREHAVRVVRVHGPLRDAITAFREHVQGVIDALVAGV